MSSTYLHKLRDPQGKGLFGCMVMIVLAGVAIYLGIMLVPVYYTNFNFESQVKTEAARAGAHFLDDEAIVKNVLNMARRHEIRLGRQDISIERFAGQLHIRVNYAVPVNLMIMDYDLKFKIDASSFIGSL